MRAGQCKSKLRMIERCARPVRCAVARFACCRERPGNVVRYCTTQRCSRVVIRLMAVHACRWLRRERRYRMALVTRRHGCMRARQRPFGLRRVTPRCRLPSWRCCMASAAGCRISSR